MHVWVVTLIVKSCIPSQIGAVDLHMPAQHSPFGTQQCHPLNSTVVPYPGCVLAPKGNHMCPHNSLVICHLILHLSKNHRFSLICKQAMLPNLFYTGTMRQIIHIIFSRRCYIKILFQCTGNKFRGIFDCWFSLIIFILQHFFCLRNITD